MKDEAMEEGSQRVSDTRQLLSSADDLETLLTAVLAVDHDAGPSRVAAHWLGALSRLVPDVAVGVFIRHPDTGESFVERVVPSGALPSWRDPARLFPSAAEETVLTLSGLPGSTLHVAPVPDSVTVGPRERRILERGAALLASSLRIAFRLESPRHPPSDGLRAQLVQAEKIASFGRVVANVVHELANPLTSIIGYAEYLGRRARARAELRDDLERIDRIRESAQRILGLSRDLISYARPSKSKGEIVALRDVVDRALSFCEYELASRGVVTEARHQEGLPPVRGAFAPLVQVFVNLVTNAAHAMGGPGGTLVVETGAGDDGSVAVARVSDTGSGMTPEVLSRVFEPFFTTKGADLGSGLGLVIVHEIITSHGGTIRAESILGTGTTFVIELPLYGPPHSTRRPLV